MLNNETVMNACWIDGWECPYDHKGLPPLTSGACKLCHKPFQYEDQIGHFFESLTGTEIEDWVDRYIDSHCSVLLTEQEVIKNASELLHNIFDVFHYFILEELSDIDRKIKENKFDVTDTKRFEFIFQMVFGEFGALPLLELIDSCLEEGDTEKRENKRKQLIDVFEKNFEKFSSNRLLYARTLKEVFFEIYNRG